MLLSRECPLGHRDRFNSLAVSCFASQRLAVPSHLALPSFLCRSWPITVSEWQGRVCHPPPPSQRGEPDSTPLPLLTERSIVRLISVTEEKRTLEQTFRSGSGHARPAAAQNPCTGTAAWLGR